MTDIPEDARPALDMLRGVGGDQMVAMLMRTFIDFGDERLSKLVEEADNHRWEEVASIAHAIKSSARQLGAVSLADACAATEAAGRGGDPAKAAEGVAAIRAAFAAARPWMQALAQGAST
jgi:HPt (histidine-containing phosphotransfer) domain-containing protein